MSYILKYLIQFLLFSLYSSTVEHDTVNIMIDVRFVLGAFKSMFETNLILIIYINDKHNKK